MSKMSIAEIVKSLQNAQNKTERLNILKNNDSSALRGILRMNYDTALKLSLPEGEPPYKKSNNPEGFGDTTLLSSHKSWYVFVKDLSPNLKQAKREFLFIKLLESLDPTEAQILLSAKDKKLNLGLTKMVIDEVFPGLIQEEKIVESVNNDNKEKPKKVSTRTASKSDGKSLWYNIDFWHKQTKWAIRNWDRQIDRVYQLCLIKKYKGFLTAII